MAQEMENQEQQQQQVETTVVADELPEKFRGKSAAEIAKMYADLESFAGRQAQELGELRAYVQALHSAPQEREPASKDEYGLAEFADELLASPEETLPKIARRIEERVLSKVARTVQSQRTTEQKIEAWFRANPDLDKFREIVSVIGERVYQANPSLSIDQVLELTGKEARAYIASLKPRLLGEGADRKRAGITTSGGGRTREAGAAAGSSEEEAAGGGGMSPDQQAILDEIKRIKDYRAKRIVPPRARE